MRELTTCEVLHVSGGDLDAGDVAMAAAGGWAAGVASFGIGMAVGGPAGGVIGGIAGFGMGMAVSIGYSLAQPDAGSYYDNGMSCVQQS